MQELQEVSPGTSGKVLGRMRDDVGVLASAINVREVEADCNPVRVRIRVCVWDLWKSSGGREADSDRR